MKSRLAALKAGLRRPYVTWLALVLLWAGPACAQTIDCVAGSSGGNYQVYLDELAYAREGLKDDAQLENLMQRLSFKLNSRVDALGLEEAPVPLTVAFCEGRKPSGQGDFSRPLVDSLDNKDVILELWGLLDAKTEGGTISERKVQICYVLVPVLLDRFDHPHKPGLQFVNYPKPGDDSGELISLLQQSSDLKAFVFVGFGVNLLRNDMYDQALEYLCKAKVMIAGLDPQGRDRGLAALLDYVKEMARLTVQRARADVNYKSTLKETLLVSETSPCP